MFLIIISLPNIVNADELKIEKSEELKEITGEVEIRYKWYKEVIEGDYYPLKDNQEGYIIDKDKIKFGPLSDWNEGNCNLPSNYYSKELNFKRIYRKVDDVRFVKLENFTFNNNVKIYHNNEQLDYRIVSVDDNTMIINLLKEYMAENLTFYIFDAKKYQISLYKDEYLRNLILSKYVEKEDLLIPDETWINNKNIYVTYYTNEILKETDLTKKVNQVQICRVRELYVYKYKILKEYYDDNYHLNVDGYIKDINDYQIFYKENIITNIIEKPITNIIEITKEKIVKEPKIEYIYIPSTNEIEKFDSSEKMECTPKIKTEVKTKIKTIEKEVFYIPKIIYMIIMLLLLIIILLLIKLRKKYVA